MGTKRGQGINGISMNWNSPAEFFAMGGYGLYVWGSFGVCAVALALEPLLVRLRHKTMLYRLRRTAQADHLDRLDQESV